MRLFSKQEVVSAKREQDRRIADQESSLIQRISDLQKTFNNEVKSISEYRKEMTEALTEELNAKKEELSSLEGELHTAQVELKQLRKPLTEEYARLKEERDQVEQSQAQLSKGWRDLEDQKNYYDQGLEDIAKAIDRNGDKALTLEKKAKSVEKQSELVQLEMAKLENLKGNFEEYVAKTKVELDNKEKALALREQDTARYQQELTHKEFTLKKLERSFVDREARINYYEK